MFHLKIVEKVFYKKRAIFPMFHRHGRLVLFFFFFFPIVLSILWSDSFSTQEGIVLFAPEESSINVQIPLENGKINMTLETYLIWMLSATMPEDYEEETMKAQAILLRTELIRSNIKKDNIIYLKKNPIIQEYFSFFFEKISKQKEAENFQKWQQAVTKTKGMYLTYQGETAIAPWFRVSAGATRNGEEVLPNQEYTALYSVPCTRDYQATDYLTNLKIKKKDYFDKLIQWMQEKETWEGTKKNNPEKIELLDIETDSVGYILFLHYNLTWKDGTTASEKIPGEIFREIFQLPSSHIEIVDMGKEILFTVKGQGHGLGMSQYAANQLAKQGMDYVGILNTFFTNIAIDKFE